MKKTVCDLSEAQSRVLEHCRSLEVTEVTIDKAYGYVLAQDLLAQMSVPFFEKSPLDGYAFYAADTKNAREDDPIRLKVTEEIAAGQFSDKELEHGCAVHILTGAPLPPGADAVAKFEETEEEPGYVTLFRSYKVNQNVVKAGEDVRKGEILAEAGTFIDEAVLGMAASQGISVLRVFKKPMVGIISQGNELMEPGELLKKGKIYNSNRYLLSASLEKEGIRSVYLGRVNDDEHEIARLLRSAVSMYDAVIMTGGVSVGTYDYTEAALEDVGAHILVDKVRLKPGSACCLAVLNGIPVFGLSGNPSSSMTTYQLLALPALRKIAGLKEQLPKYFKAKLEMDFNKKSPITRVLKGHLAYKDCSVYFVQNENQRNGSVSAMKNQQAFAMIPAGSGPLKAETVVDVLLLSC